ncbi:MAG: carboxylating nicotinate-nucleotide diphosphorylase [Bacteriovoracaceae bacterium]
MDLNIHWQDKIKSYAQEDGLDDNLSYLSSLPTTPVLCTLKVKSDAVLAGLSAFTAVFDYLNEDKVSLDLLSWEGKKFKKEDQFNVSFKLPFNVALSGERLALNLLSRASAVATHTSRFVEKAKPFGIEILDTRKTTPGLKALEKYAVTVGGGKNHRFGSTEILMVKDNHKKIFGSLTEAYKTMQSMAGFYSPIIVEIHDLEELKIANELSIKHMMLDNFHPHQITEALKMKKMGTTFELSGGMNLENISLYLKSGVDAISIGGITHNPPPVDISLKLSKL